VAKAQLTVIAMVLSLDDNTQCPCDLILPPRGNSYDCVLEFKPEDTEAITAVLQGQNTVPGTKENGDPTLKFTVEAPGLREAAQAARSILSAGAHHVGDTQYIYATGIEDEDDPFVIMETPGDTFDVTILCALGTYVNRLTEALKARQDLGIAKVSSYLKVILPGYVDVDFVATASQERLAQYQAMAEIYAALDE
jgi:hypothetical protein